MCLRSTLAAYRTPAELQSLQPPIKRSTTYQHPIHLHAENHSRNLSTLKRPAIVIRAHSQTLFYRHEDTDTRSLFTFLLSVRAFEKQLLSSKSVEGSHTDKIFGNHSLHDERNVLTQYAPTTRILQVSGLIPSQRGFEWYPQLQRFTRFREFFEDKANGSQWRAGDHASFIKLYGELYEYVMAHADVIVANVSLAGNAAFACTTRKFTTANLSDCDLR
jgi:hypothetical protein